MLVPPGVTGSKRIQTEGKKSLPVFIEARWNGLSKYTAETWWKDDRSGERQGGLGPGPLGSGFLSSCFGSGNCGGKTGNQGGEDAAPGRSWSGGVDQ